MNKKQFQFFATVYFIKIQLTRKYIISVIKKISNFKICLIFMLI
jgi:hypothetical protein